MNILRWFLIVSTTLALLLWIILITWAESFRRSFGASGNPEIVIYAPIAIFTIFLLIFIWPRPGFLYLLPAFACPGILACLWISPQAPFLCVIGLTYCISAMVFFWGRL